ncbi:hypothetical protein L226DRAFT_234418 [Lentinus tigrinus ALCF2SS1-7]|uniref:Uncharacterized protein n=1 Tax=Lentinus tigrinus ALCF2SS1-6 TaxID=1328759 RepID=A0A5C2SQ12_9APHY|nr:hypothetical protein L227DRAFT_219841 [Lentinus tigrinus ALCF2SS1-6]RPD78865.1 hypothetical protein L226DRAFT_234418 [Lentinus tigrinus ALCF2SS1-7]
MRCMSACVRHQKRPGTLATLCSVRGRPRPGTGMRVPQRFQSIQIWLLARASPRPPSDFVVLVLFFNAVLPTLPPGSSTPRVECAYLVMHCVYDSSPSAVTTHPSFHPILFTLSHTFYRI